MPVWRPPVMPPHPSMSVQGATQVRVSELNALTFATLKFGIFTSFLTRSRYSQTPPPYMFPTQYTQYPQGQAPQGQATQVMMVQFDCYSFRDGAYILAPTGLPWSSNPSLYVDGPINCQLRDVSDTVGSADATAYVADTTGTYECQNIFNAIKVE
jgi:hypothetical protein